MDLQTKCAVATEIVAENLLALIGSRELKPSVRKVLRGEVAKLQNLADLISSK